MNRYLFIGYFILLGLIIGGPGPPDGVEPLIDHIFPTGPQTYSDNSGAASGASSTQVANSQEHTVDCHLFATRPYSTGLDINGSGTQLCIGSAFTMETTVKLQKRNFYFWWTTLDTESTEGTYGDDNLHSLDVYATCISGTHSYRSRAEGILITLNGIYTRSANSPSYQASC